MGFILEEKREFETQGLINRAQEIIEEYNEIIDVDELMQMLYDLNSANNAGNKEETNGLIESLFDLIEDIEESIKKK